MNKKIAILLLAVFGNALILTVGGFSFVLLIMRLWYLGFAAAALFFSAAYCAVFGAALGVTWGNSGENKTT